MAIDPPKNRYVVITPWSPDQVSWNPFDPADLPVPDCAYIGNVIAAMEKDPTIRDLTFYVTFNLYSLPSYGDDVVVILLGDEWCRIPRYAFKVRAIFKTYGTQLPFHWGALAHPTAHDLAALVQDLRTTLQRLPNLVAAAVSFAGHIVRGRLPKWRIHDFPLGYYRQIELPFVALEKRQVDVYFAGSISNRNASSALYRLSPKYLSRERMLDQLQTIIATHPNLAITTALTGTFGRTTDEEALQYSQTMMATKICLVPRGTSLETYRYFEGLRFGCVVVAERLPRRWFYHGSSAISVRTWSELERLIPALLADPERLTNLSHASLAWWAEHCSEDAVGQYLAAQLRDSVQQRSQPAIEREPHQGHDRARNAAVSDARTA